MKSCNTCRWALFEDYGYSNYTVEGTSFSCLKYQHPEDGFDRFYGVDKRLNFAEECKEYVEGDPVELDVDLCDFPGTMYPEVIEVLKNLYER